VSAVEPREILSVRAELERQFKRTGRNRLRRWCIGLLVSLILVVAGFQVYYQLQYGTLAWWSPPARLAYCGLTYERVPADDAVIPAKWENLVEVASIPPLSRPVLSAQDDLRTLGSCADPIYYRSGSGELTEYAYPTV
jgi:hypothetical protein